MKRGGGLLMVIVSPILTFLAASRIFLFGVSESHRACSRNFWNGPFFFMELF